MTTTSNLIREAIEGLDEIENSCLEGLSPWQAVGNVLARLQSHLKQVELEERLVEDAKFGWSTAPRHDDGSGPSTCHCVDCRLYKSVEALTLYKLSLDGADKKEVGGPLADASNYKTDEQGE